MTGRSAAAPVRSAALRPADPLDGGGAPGLRPSDGAPTIHRRSADDPPTIHRRCADARHGIRRSGADEAGRPTAVPAYLQHFALYAAMRTELCVTTKSP
jgi:hypothetical protein